jgi:tRNA (cmo5U34)-methyltransferase
LGQFHFTPERYLELMRAEVPDYERIQDEVAAATERVAARAVLELGVGTGETSRRVLDRHPGARLIGIDESEEMLAAAGAALRDRDVDLRAGRLQDPLPPGPFDLAVSAFAVHHLDARGKADLFARVAAALAPGGRFAIADVVVPADPADAVTPSRPASTSPTRCQTSWNGWPTRASTRERPGQSATWQCSWPTGRQPLTPNA